jgi:hypothetical protein
MWYGNDEQLVRAPTPLAFDKLVQNLEDNDSVMFQSISFLRWAGRKDRKRLRVRLVDFRHHHWHHQ